MLLPPSIPNHFKNQKKRLNLLLIVGPLLLESSSHSWVTQADEKLLSGDTKDCKSLKSDSEGPSIEDLIDGGWENAFFADRDKAAPARAHSSSPTQAFLFPTGENEALI